MSTRLSQDGLSALAGRVAVPRYDRRELKAGILHIGGRQFPSRPSSRLSRRSLQPRLDRDWAIVGAGVRDSDEVMRQELSAQDLLTTESSSRRRIIPRHASSGQ